MKYKLKERILKKKTLKIFKSDMKVESISNTLGRLLILFLKSNESNHGH